MQSFLRGDVLPEHHFGRRWILELVLKDGNHCLKQLDVSPEDSEPTALGDPHLDTRVRQDTHDDLTGLLIVVVLVDEADAITLECGYVRARVQLLEALLELSL